MVKFLVDAAVYPINRSTIFSPSHPVYSHARPKQKYGRQLTTSPSFSHLPPIAILDRVHGTEATPRQTGATRYPFTRSCSTAFQDLRGFRNRWLYRSELLMRARSRHVSRKMLVAVTIAGFLSAPEPNRSNSAVQTSLLQHPRSVQLSIGDRCTRPTSSAAPRGTNDATRRVSTRDGGWFSRRGIFGSRNLFHKISKPAI